MVSYKSKNIFSITHGWVFHDYYFMHLMNDKNHHKITQKGDLNKKNNSSSSCCCLAIKQLSSSSITETVAKNKERITNK